MRCQALVAFGERCDLPYWLIDEAICLGMLDLMEYRAERDTPMSQRTYEVVPSGSLTAEGAVAAFLTWKKLAIL